MSEITVHMYDIKVGYPDAFGDGEIIYDIVGMLFMNDGYNNAEVVEQYLDSDEIATYAGEFKQVGQLNVLNSIPPVYRISLDD